MKDRLTNGKKDVQNHTKCFIKKNKKEIILLEPKQKYENIIKCSEKRHETREYMRRKVVAHIFDENDKTTTSGSTTCRRMQQEGVSKEENGGTIQKRDRIQ